MPKPSDIFPTEYFIKRDPSDDDRFYDYPRMVAHIDDGAIKFLGGVYAALLPQKARLLDLMSSRYTHLPAGFEAGFVHATGMNGDELEANPQLDDYVVQNLNKTQTLPFADAEFDGAMCCVSVQYLEKPVEVFVEVERALKPGAPFIVSFSNRCFPTKAMAVWLNTSDRQHLAYVTQIFEAAGFGEISTRVKRGGLPGFGGDPLYAVIGYAG